MEDEKKKMKNYHRKCTSKEVLWHTIYTLRIEELRQEAQKTWALGFVEKQWIKMPDRQGQLGLLEHA